MLSLVTGVWATGWALFAVRKLLQGYRNSVLPVMIVLGILTGLPLLLDVLVGRPSFLNNPSFRLANSDEVTNIIYCGYVAAVPPILWRFGRAKRTETNDHEISWQNASKGIQVVLATAVLSPFLALTIAPDPAIYEQYGAALIGKLVGDVDTFHSYIAILSRISILATGALLLMTKRLRAYHFLIAAPAVLGSLWLIGKRADVALAALVLIYVVWQQRLLKGPQFVALGAGLAVAMGLFSLAYQSNLRGDESGGVASGYETLRVDYGRDAQIRMSIFAQQHPDQMKILEYPGESYLFDATFFVPRQMWKDKPLPYAQYFTSAMYRQPPKVWGWGMTTSWLEEALSNFGRFGYVFAPLSLALFCKFGDRQTSALVRFLTVIVACLALAVQMSAFMPLVILWLGLFWLNRRTNRRLLRRSLQRAVAPHNSGRTQEILFK